MLNNYTVSANSVAGIRWFELRRTQPGNWSIFQQSTYQPDTTWRWMGGIASDNQGNPRTWLQRIQQFDKPANPLRRPTSDGIIEYVVG